MEQRTVAVIGGGAAGLIAAGVLSKRVKKVLLIEKNNLLAKKVRITGKGRCNITNTADIPEILENIPTNSKFMYSALYSFSNYDVINLFESLGVKTKEERGGRIFPESDSAREVAEALVRFALSKNVEWIKDEALRIIVDDNKVRAVKCKKKTYDVDSVILATGGKSYPLTGSDGAGYKMARELGHTIITPHPSLVGVVTEEKWCASCMGLSLKNVNLSLYSGNKMIFSDFGEMLFTHFGVTGPIVLSSSAHIKEASKKNYSIKIDLKPALSKEQLDARLVRDFEKFSKKDYQNSLDDLLPKALIPVIIELSGIDPRKKTAQVSKTEREKLCSLLKQLPLSVKGLRDISEAIVTSGGIKVSEIDPSTMESKIISGLFFAGEIIDVDAYTGGFNLQIAFSTGHLAGENA